MTAPSDDRSPMAIAAAWSARIVTISFEMVVPGLIGYWIDQKLGTQILFALLGFALGLSFGTWHLVRMAQASEREPPPDNHS